MKGIELGTKWGPNPILTTRSPRLFPFRNFFLTDLVVPNFRCFHIGRSQLRDARHRNSEHYIPTTSCAEKNAHRLSDAPSTADARPRDGSGHLTSAYPMMQKGSRSHCDVCRRLAESVRSTLFFCEELREGDWAHTPPHAARARVRRGFTVSFQSEA